MRPRQKSNVERILVEMKHPKASKTNAMRLLEQAKIPYTMHEYETADGALDGVSVAHKTGCEPARVYKTLVTKGVSGGVYVFCVPVEKELDLKAAARAAGEKSVAMVAVSEITPLTGYVKGGCSPVGMKKSYSTFLQRDALDFATILVSGGRIGLQIEVEPKALLEATGGTVAQLAQG